MCWNDEEGIFSMVYRRDILTSLTAGALGGGHAYTLALAAGTCSAALLALSISAAYGPVRALIEPGRRAGLRLLRTPSFWGAWTSRVLRGFEPGPAHPSR